MRESMPQPGWLIRVFPLTMVWLLFAGCTGPASSTMTKPQQNDRGNSETAKAEADGNTRCEELLNNVIGQYQPRTVDLIADQSTALGQLNDWLKSCAAGDFEVGEIPPALEEEITGGVPDALVSGRFRERDSEYLRDVMLMRAIARHTTRDARTDAERALALFDYVVQTIAMEPETTFPPVLSLYDHVVLGAGNPADRGAVLAELLRQVKMDSFVLWEWNPQGEFSPRQRFLVAVPTADGVLLFLPALGQPLWKVQAAEGAESSPPAGDLAARARRIATWADLRAKPDLLSQFSESMDPSRQIQSADLDRLSAGLVVTAVHCSGRMERLQSQLSGDLAATVHVDVGDTPTGPGLVSRIVKAGAGEWSTEKIHVWPYLNSLLTNRRKIDAPHQQHLQMKTLKLGAPFEVRTNDQGQVSLGQPQRLFLKMRLAHCMGDFEEATSGYPNEVILACKQMLNLPLPDGPRVMHLDAVDEALYFLGICQYEQKQYKIAASTFTRYQLNFRRLLAAALQHEAPHEYSQKESQKLDALILAAMNAPVKLRMADVLLIAVKEAQGQDAVTAQRNVIATMVERYYRLGASQLFLARCAAALGDLKTAAQLAIAVAVNDPAGREARVAARVWDPSIPPLVVFSGKEKAANPGDELAPPGENPAVKKPQSAPTTDAKKDGEPAAEEKPKAAPPGDEPPASPKSEKPE